MDILLGFHICIDMKRNILVNAIKTPFLMVIGFLAIVTSAIIGIYNIYKQK